MQSGFNRYLIVPINSIQRDGTRNFLPIMFKVYVRFYLTDISKARGSRVCEWGSKKNKVKKSYKE